MDEPAPHASNIERALHRIRQMTTARSERAERIALGISVVTFAIALAVGIATLPAIEGGVRAGWLLLVAAFVPVAVVANAAEYRVTAAVAGHDEPWANSIRIAVLASAFNLLPMPGAVLIRMRAMMQAGSTAGSAAGATAIVGLAFLGMSIAAAGVLLSSTGDDQVLGGLLLTGGIVASGVALALLKRRVGVQTTTLAIEIATVELASFAVKGIRIYAAARVIGVDLSAAQSAALAVAGVAALALGFFPGGLGIRELLAAAIAPIVGVSAAVGAVAASIDRIVGLAILGVVAGILTMRSPTAEGSAEIQLDP